MRRSAVALVAAAALVTAEIAIALVAPTAEFAFVLILAVAVASLFPALALEAFALRTPTALVVTRFTRRRALGGNSRGIGFDRRIGAGFTEILVAVASS